MDLEIQDKLEEIYKNLGIEVSFLNFRLYGIKITINHNNINYESKIEYKYNCHLTIDANIDKIRKIIEKEIILKFYLKGE